MAISAQDAQYSQFYNAPLYLNPALTATKGDDMRIGANYRTQWAAIHDPYTNYGAFLEIRKNIFGLGFLLNQEQAGDASLKTSNLALSFAIHKKLARGKNRLSAGLLVGLIQQGFNPLNFTFDQQYDYGVGYNPDLSTQESFENTRILIPNLSIGLNWDFNLTKEGPLAGQLGFAFHHINRAKSSFYTDNVVYPLKTTVHALLDFQLTKQLHLSPKFLFAKQLAAQDFVVGADLIFNMNATNSFRIGLGNRLKDAMIFYAGFDIGKASLGISYDNNISPLKPITVRNSALELSAVLRFGKTNNIHPSQQFKDKDKDGIVDREDDCPEIAGLKSNHGCPKELQTKENDFDGDGINDENDLCPYKFGYAKYQGCTDRDGDGVWDHIDACPVTPGTVENYGCPVDSEELDSDGDGILDKYDKCVYIKGVAEFFGCPDTDGDHIPDLDDLCPYLKGTASLNGCPEKNNNISTKNIFSTIIHFASNKEEIRDYYYPQLDKVVTALKFNPNYRVVIEGHTDNEGDAAYNYMLSQRRASVIQNYLMSKGIPSERMASFYYGETKPVSSNNSESGKAKNRRTEIIIIEN